MFSNRRLKDFGNLILKALPKSERVDVLPNNRSEECDDKNQKGQGLVEYALILTLTSVASIVILTFLGPLIGNVFSTINSSLSSFQPMSFYNTDSMSVPRGLYSGTLLNNGKVLATGGYDSTSGWSVFTKTELYDLQTGLWNSAGDMHDARGLAHTNTLLNDGKVLVAGGDGHAGALASAELYDPDTGTWSYTGSMNVARYFHTATLLNNGKVLVVGGYNYNLGIRLDSAELYDPTTGSWSLTGNMSAAREGHTTTLLNNGKVLVVGGHNDTNGKLASAELYDPATGSWSGTGNMSAARQYHTATLLNNGKVLVAGGAGSSGGSLISAEIYDPALGTWSPTGSMNTARYNHTANSLNDGRVLVIGGYHDNTYGNLASAEIYEPATGEWNLAGDLNVPRDYHFAIVLNDGTVLVAGGGGVRFSGDGLPLTSTELGNFSPGNTFFGTLSLPSDWLNSTHISVQFAGNTSEAAVNAGALSNDGNTWGDWIAITPGETITTTWDVVGEGYVPIYLRLRDVNGRVATAVVEPVMVDLSQPTATMTALPPKSSANIPLAWSGSDAVSGVAAYDVQARVGTDGTWTDVLSNTTNTSTNYAGINGVTYYFRVRAYDMAGNVGDWSPEVHTDTFVVTCTLPTFGAITNFAVGANPQSVAVGDFNKDGKLDLVIANYASNTVSVLLGNGMGGFGTATNYATGMGPSFVAIGDFNKDNKLDLAVANRNSNTFSVLLGDGTGGFGAATNFAVAPGPVSVATGDFNGDSKLDLVTTNVNSTMVSIRLGTGTGGFGAVTNFAVGAEPFSVVIGDFNKDGNQDLAVANRVSHNISVLLGNGAGSFGAATNFAVGAEYPPAIAVDDFNHDGKQDLATANGGSANISILLGSGDGSFSTPTNFPVGVNPGSVSPSDFNSDGKQDLAVINWNTSDVSVLLGSGDGSFGTPTNFALGTNPRSSTVGDFNNDGKQDIATVNTPSNNISILLNTCADSTLPGVTVNQASSQPDPATTPTINFTATFSEQINPITFTGADISLGGTAGATTAMVSEISPHDGTTFNIAVSGMTNDGTVTAALDAGVIQDPSGNNNTASSSADNSITYIFAYATVSGNAGIGNAVITYTGGSSIADGNGAYSIAVFKGWSGTVTPSKPGYTFSPVSKSYTNVTADQIQDYNATLNTYTLTYAAGAHGSISGTSSQTVNHGASGTAVTAVPDTGYHFVNWSDGVLTAARTDINITGDISVTANFAINTYTLTYTAGMHGSITGTSPQTVNHGASGTEVTAVPDTGYHFVIWSDGVLTASRTDTNITGNSNVTAYFIINSYNLLYTTGTHGSITGTTFQTVNHGADGTTVTAVPDTGYHFVNWSDGVLTASRTDTNVIGDISVTANFAINTYALTVKKTGTGSGTVTSSPLGISCGANCSKVFNYGTVVTLTATPATGFVFTGWSGVCTGTGTCTVTMSAAKTVTANFTLIVSVGAYDGWVLEAGENSNAGGTLNATTATFMLGDDAARKQYRGILHFDTATLPDTAVITKVTLKMMKAGGSGNTATLGSLLVDMTKPAFGAATLALSDFQAVAGKPNIFNPFTILGNWYSATLKSSGFTYVNRTGTTQFRLRFSKDDDNDSLADYLMFYSGNAANAATRPQLLIQYYVP